MSITTNDRLFDEFAKQTFNDWKVQAIKELKGKAYEDVLVWQAEQKLHIEALYSEEHLTELNQSISAALRSEWTQAQPAWGRSWRNSIRLSIANEYETNQAALQWLNKGVNELIFETGHQVPDLHTLLHNIEPAYCALSWHVPEQQATALIKAYTELLKTRQIKSESLTGTLYISDGQHNAVLLQKLLQENTLPLRFISLHTTASTAIDRIADLLRKSHQLNRKLIAEGLSPAQLCKQSCFVWPAGNKYFIEIAAIRALRLLATELFAAYEEQSSITNADVYIHVETQVEQKQDDPYWNLLSNTTQAMAAIIGNADGLLVAPFNKTDAESGSLAQRMAVNVSNILAEESYFGKVSDPAAGAYYIESLTQQLIEQSWEKFTESIKDN